MSRTITVKGIGEATFTPDYVIVSISLSSKDLNYDKAMQLATQDIAQLTEAMCSIGFAATDLKTKNFKIRPHYTSTYDKNRNEIRKFDGYVIDHELNLEFIYDVDKLSQVLAAIADSTSNPDLDLHFTVKDREAAMETLLRSAAKNARKKAEILCQASGVTLGQLLNIDYDWEEIEFYGDTRCRSERCIMLGAAPAIHPENIHVSDTAAFIWEIA